MAINFTSVFEDLGAVIKAVNTLRNVAADGTGDSISGLRDNLYSVLNGNSTDATIPNIAGPFDSLADAYVARLTTIADLADTRISDQTTILDELKLQETDIQSLLREIIRDMEIQSVTVNKSLVGAPSATGLAGNVGDGLMLTTIKLDGSAPSPGYPANLDYVDKDSELAVTERITLTCVADSDRDALPRGHEVFNAVGQTPFRTTWDWKPEGSGVNTNISTDNAVDIMANRNFELWTAAGELSNWDSVLGAPGVEFAANHDLTYVHGGSSSMQVLDDCTFEQAIPPQTLQPNRYYRITFWTKADSTSSPNITLSVVSPAGVISIPAGPTKAGVTAGGFVHTSGLVLMPANLPDDLIFRLSIDTVTTEFWIDRMSFAPVNYVGGVGINLLAGATDFSIGDRYPLDVTNVEGTIQQFFRRKYRIQLPSDASPSILDSLAE